MFPKSDLGSFPKSVNMFFPYVVFLVEGRFPYELSLLFYKRILLQLSGRTHPQKLAVKGKVPKRL